jgi:hypothetical protein
MGFNPSSSYSLGVEIEFQILDSNEFALVPFAPKAVDLGSSTYFNQLDGVISGGTGADLMQRIYQHTDDLSAAFSEIYQGFWT